MQTILANHWHHLPESEVLELLESDAQKGLDRFEIQHRQERFGKNAITPAKGKSALMRFLMQLHNPLIYILLASSVITAFIKDPVDALLILAIVLINGVIGYIQETRAEKAIQALTQAMTTEALVVRAGQTVRVSSVELVPGDVVVLQAGAKIPADLRLLRTRDLQVAEAALTGESVPVEKAAGLSLPTDTVLADRKNMAYASTLVTYGQGVGVVTATGDGTEIGRISQLIAEARDLETPLTQKIARFSRLVLYVILALAAVTFGVGLLRGQDAVQTFAAAVALAVAMIPEGLPAALTLTMAIGVTRMARRRAIIRKLPAVETLGSVTVICSDKTGTLTQNQMMVQEIRAGEARYQVNGAGYNPQGELLRDGQAQTLKDAPTALVETLTAGLLCNDSHLVEEQGQWTAQGDPTEVALISAARKLGLDAESTLARFPRLDGIPFDSQHQYMATLHKDPAGGRVIYLKGAAEVVLERCDTALGADGQPTALRREEVHQAVEEMANAGLRVLALAMGRGCEGAGGTVADTLHPQDVSGGLVFLGLQGMIDPPRAEAIAAVQACQRAGIQVKMITGDHPRTAAAIAAQIGIQQGAQTETLTGKQLAAFSDQELIAAAERVAVFARVSPEQKLRLVEALQARGQVVAMTGDGVNDGPALKQANIGIAMGITGTEVAKEAADIILTDDNFATIEAAVEEGRGVFDNLTRIIAWTLPTNLGQGLIILAAILLGLALPILPVHALWINTISAGVLGLVLAFERKEANIMQRKPRAPETPILTRELLWRMAIVSAMILAAALGLYEVSLWNGLSEAQARTVAVNVVIMIQIFYLFNCRSLVAPAYRMGIATNPWVVVSVLSMLVLQALFTYTPLMNRIMYSAPIGWESWAQIVAAGVASYLVIEVEKWVRRRG